MDVAGNDSALPFFTAFGFTNEGKRHRSVHHSHGNRQVCDEQEERGAWKDMASLAMLDMEWVMRKSR